MTNCLCVSNNRRLDCLVSGLFRRRSNKTSKLCVTCLCEGNQPVTGAFRWRRDINTENVSTWWRHHVTLYSYITCNNSHAAVIGWSSISPSPTIVMTNIEWTHGWQATGLGAWASRMKCPARFVSHLHEICIYILVVYSLCFFCCLFITVTWWYVWCIEWAGGNQEEVQACLVTLWLFIL